MQHEKKLYYICWENVYMLVLVVIMTIACFGVILVVNGEHETYHVRDPIFHMDNPLY